MAQVIKRKKHFQIVVSLGYGADGKQIRKTTTFVPPENTTQKKAEKLANEFAIDFERKCKGMAALDENMRFSELVEQYRTLYMPNKLKGVTIYTYDGQIKKYLLPEFANIKLKDFSPARISSFFQNVDIQPESCRKLLIILKSIFTFAVKQGFLVKSPCVDIILPESNKMEDETKPIITEHQIRELLGMLNSDSVINSQFSVIIQTLIYTGMRTGECLGLQWQDLDFENKLIHIRHTLCYDGSKTWLDVPKTAKSRRCIAMGDELAAILINHKHRQEIVANKLGSGFNKMNMVFTSKTGNYKDRSGLLQEFKRFIKNTDFSDICLHTLRHANATLLLSNGIDIKLVSEHLGHSTIVITGDLYADVLEKSKRQMADLISLRLA